MKRALIDMSSVVWTCLRAGKDNEFGTKVTTASGKEVLVNSAGYGYENAIAHLTTMMDDLSVTPRQMIFVVEGKDSKSHRQFIYPQYKAKRDDDKVPQMYEAFNEVKRMLLESFLAVGAQAVTQDGIEADDVLAYLAKHLKGERWIVSGDKDLAQCVGGDVHHWRMGLRDKNPFGEFSHDLIPVYQALVGDSDEYPGVKGFGNVAFMNLLMTFGEEGLRSMRDLIVTKQLLRLEEDVAEFKPLQKIIDDAQTAYTCFELATLQVSRVNTLRRPLRWTVGMTKQRQHVPEERLRRYAGECHLVHAGNYDEMLDLFRRQASITPEFALDVETSTPPESDEWLAMGDREDKVDVLGSELTSLQITCGRNSQHTFYLAIDNREEPDVRNITVEQCAAFVDEIPQQKITWVHFAGFELPVCYNAFGHLWKDDPKWHGFLRNVRDSRLAGHYADENRSLHLKSLSKELLGHEQQTYQQTVHKNYALSDWHEAGCPGKLITDFDQDMYEGDQVVGKCPMVTVEHKMNELTAREVFSYGCDDTICTIALANHFRTVMEIEDTWNVFEQVETLTSYVQAKAFVDGIPFSLERMAAAERDDDEKYDKAWAVLRAYLIEIGFEGTVCPAFDEITAPAIKEAHQIVLGTELKTLVRTPDKLAKMIEQTIEDQPDEFHAQKAQILVKTIRDNDLASFNVLVRDHFKGEPVLNLGSPKQMKDLLYDKLKLPVNWINDVTDNEKANDPELADACFRFKRKLNGSNDVEIRDSDRDLLVRKAKTNDVAIQFALAFDEEHIDDKARAALKALGEMKKVMTRRSLFYKKYWHAKHWKDGKLHPNVLQCGAVTRRPTGSDPNPFQWPKKGEGVRFRENILPHKKDAVVVSIDFTGQELRLAAERSQDANMLACYIGDNLKDPHSITAAGAMVQKWGKEKVSSLFATHGADLARDTEGSYQLFLKLRELGKSDPMGKESDDLRKDAKNVNFTAQFGGRAPKIAERIIMRVSDAQLFLDAREKMFPDLLTAAERAEDFAAANGYALTMLGARRHLREAVLSDDKQTVSRAERQAWNMEIQGSAGEMMKLAMVRMWENGVLHKYDLVFYVSVYDELVFSVHRDHALDAIREVNAYMTAPYANMAVPILASISLGPDYGHQIECGDWFIPERIVAALNDTFKLQEVA